MTIESQSPNLPISVVSHFIHDGRFSQEEIEDALDRHLSGKALTSAFRFPPALERAWWTHYSIEALPLQRWDMLSAFAFYTAYLAYAWPTLVQNFDPYLAFVFLVFGVPGNAALLVATFLEQGWRYSNRIATLGAVWHTVGLALFYLRCQELSLSIPSIALVVIVFFDFYLLGLGFIYGAVLAAMALCLAPIVVGLDAKTPAEATATLFFIATATVIGAIGAFLAERTQRISWLRSLLLSHIADHDGLTKLLNRTAFHQRAQVMLRFADRTQSPCTLLTLDVDHFKQYNDRHGHPAGDECLRLVGQEVGTTGRRPLDLMARLGGEEFGILLYGSTIEQAKALAEQLAERIRALKPAEGEPVTASFGLSEYRPRTDSLKTLLHRSDTALYTAKKSGRNQICAA